MTYPPKPWTDGQTFTENGTVYTYDLSTNSWNFNKLTYNRLQNAISVEIPKGKHSFEIEFSREYDFSINEFSYKSIENQDRSKMYVVTDEGGFAQLDSSIVNGNQYSRFFFIPDLDLSVRHFGRFRWIDENGKSDKWIPFIVPCQNIGNYIREEMEESSTVPESSISSSSVIEESSIVSSSSVVPESISESSIAQDSIPESSAIPESITSTGVVIFESDGTVVSSAMAINDAVLTSGQSMIVYYSGTADGTTVNNYAQLYVSSGGIVSNTTNDYRMRIYSGGTAIDNTVNGDLLVWGGSAINNTINYHPEHDLNYRGTVENFDGYDEHTVINSACSMYTAGSSAISNNNIVNSGGVYSVSAGGIINSTVVSSGGTLSVRNGGTATEIIASSGAILNLDVSSDNYAQGTSGGSSFITSNGTMSNYTINQGETVKVESGGTANTITVMSGGSFDVVSGGTALVVTSMTGAIITGDGRIEYVSSGNIIP